MFYHQINGFCTKLSTSDGLIKVINIVMEDINIVERVLVVFRSLKKAFYTLSYRILLNRLHEYWIGGKGLIIFSCYLTDCKQRVIINKQVSNHLPLK